MLAIDKIESERRRGAWEGRKRLVREKKEGGQKHASDQVPARAIAHVFEK